MLLLWPPPRVACRSDHTGQCAPGVEARRRANALGVGLLAPVGTPAAVITRLNTELNAVLNDAAVREKLRVMGIEPTPGTAEQYRDEIKRDLDRYGAVVKAAGISIE